MNTRDNGKINVIASSNQQSDTDTTTDMYASSGVN